MKRFLSILLIAAALFAIYGDYVNITDIFACKTYWEEESDKSEEDLNKLGAGITKLKKNRKAYNKTVKQLAKSRKSLAAAEAKYAATAAKMGTLKSDYKKGVNKYKSMSELIKEISTVRTEYKSWKTSYDKLNTNRKNVIKAVDGPDPNKAAKKDTVRKMLLEEIAVLIYDKNDRDLFTASVKSLSNDDQTATGYNNYALYCATVYTTIENLFKEQSGLYTAAKAIASLKYAELSVALKEKPELYEAAIVLVRRFDPIEADDAKGVVDRAIDGSTVDLKTIKTCSNAKARTAIMESYESLRWLRSYVTSGMKNSDTVRTNAYKLAKGQDKIAEGVSSISSTILGNSTYKKAVKKEMGRKAIKALETYKKDPNPLNTTSIDFAGFEKQMDKEPGLNESLQKAQKLLTTNRADLKKDVSKAKSRYTANYKAYKAYPKKLETARKNIEKLEESIAQYEKGEKESKKGLTTLVNEKPDGDLESIKDRVGGNENFDDGKGNLDIEKGQEAVDAGEAYLNERGDDITKEITGRIIGTVLGIISAVLALLAALLSLFKSNRGAAIISCIAAVTAAGGAGLGEAAGEIYSVLAGSTVGELPWIAVMVLAGVAMVFAIVHFSAKIEEPLTDE